MAKLTGFKSGKCRCFAWLHSISENLKNSQTLLQDFSSLHGAGYFAMIRRGQNYRNGRNALVHHVGSVIKRGRFFEDRDTQPGGIL